MRNLSEINQLADQRLTEADALNAAGLYDGAFYLAGYAVELTLKGKICQRLGFPSLLDENQPNLNTLNQTPGISEIRRMIKSHNLNLLLILAGLKESFDVDKAASLELQKVWSLISKWDEHCRYQPCGHVTPQDADQVISLLKDANGFISWIRRQ